MLTLNTKQKEFVDAAKKMYNKSTLSNNELKKVAKSLKVGFTQWLNRNPELRVGRGKYKLPLDHYLSLKLLLKKQLLIIQKFYQIQNLKPRQLRIQLLKKCICDFFFKW